MSETQFACELPRLLKAASSNLSAWEACMPACTLSGFGSLWRSVRADRPTR